MMMKMSAMAVFGWGRCPGGAYVRSRALTAPRRGHLRVRLVSRRGGGCLHAAAHMFESLVQRSTPNSQRCVRVSTTDSRLGLHTRCRTRSKHPTARGTVFTDALERMRVADRGLHLQR